MGKQTKKSKKTKKQPKKTKKKSSSSPVAVEDILRGTAHALTIFNPNAIAGLSIFLKRG